MDYLFSSDQDQIDELLQVLPTRIPLDIQYMILSFHILDVSVNSKVQVNIDDRWLPCKIKDTFPLSMNVNCLRWPQYSSVDIKLHYSNIKPLISNVYNHGASILSTLDMTDLTEIQQIKLQTLRSLDYMEQDCITALKIHPNGKLETLVNCIYEI